MAINSVIHSLVQIGDNAVIKQLAELRQNIQENDDILNSIIKVLSSKSKANEDWTTYGAHIVDTFHEAMECCTEDKKGQFVVVLLHSKISTQHFMVSFCEGNLYDGLS
jgi:hypothetical protein